MPCVWTGSVWKCTRHYLCPFEGLHGAVPHAGRAPPNVQGVVEEGAVLRGELERPVPHRGEF